MKKHTYKGYEITRGSYKGTTDDCIDGWYIDDPESTTIDRRGKGHRTLEEAKEQIDEWEQKAQAYKEKAGY
ncbi:hypothetical protein [Brevibacillus sp. 179-C9.3 HS]|uniref:hypothetical protein n=1 Tax=unclassified Brevibacillus TaxID=2684853 RepID=UPI00399F29A8